MDIGAEYRRAIEIIDVGLARRLWAHTDPSMPQPATDDEVRVALHYARTAAESATVPRRCYSHRWLVDRGLPSGLPDHLKPAADRLYPRAVSAVGIAVKSRVPGRAAHVRGAMEAVVLDLYADGKTDPAIVRPAMLAARERALRQ